MFSEDKSSRKFSKIGSRLDADFAVSISKLCYSNTFASRELKLSRFLRNKRDNYLTFSTPVR